MGFTPQKRGHVASLWRSLRKYNVHTDYKEKADESILLHGGEEIVVTHPLGLSY